MAGSGWHAAGFNGHFPSGRHHVNPGHALHLREPAQLLFHAPVRREERRVRHFSWQAWSSMQPVIYRKRRGPISRGEREWRVEPDALVTVGPTGRERRYPWRDIVAVRLCQHPTHAKPFRYVFELQPRHERKVAIDNVHFIARGQFEERSDSYTPFVRAALERIAAENPNARALMGETPKRYFFLLLAALVGLGGLAFVLAAVRTPIDALPGPYAALVKLVIILLMLPIFWRWMMKALPHGVEISDIPSRALPPER
jgi:hypothetical protein